MDDKYAALNRLEEEILQLHYLKSDLRAKKKYLRRCKCKNLRVQALVNSTLVEVVALQRVKMLEQNRLEIEVRIATSSDKLSNQWDEKTCEDINSLNRFMRVRNEMKKKLKHVLFGLKYFLPVILLRFFLLHVC
jgi:hypothetical protein